MTFIEDEAVSAKIPKAFLEAYPFPAFVLVTAISPQLRPRLASRDTDITVRPYDDVSPLAGPSRLSSSPSNPVVWGNASWYGLLEGRNLGDCMTAPSQNRFQAWLEGAEAIGIGKGASSHRNGIVDNRPLVLDLSDPQVTLHLTKTSLPLSPTHALMIITSQAPPRSKSPEGATSPLVKSSYTMGRTTSSSASFSASSATGHRGSDATTASGSDSLHRLSTSSDLQPLGRESQYRAGSSSSDSPSYFPGGLAGPRENRLGSRQRRQSPNRVRSPIPRSVNVQAKEYWELLNSIDWSKTSIGSRSSWKSWIDPLLSVTFESKSQDCVWLGPDLHMIYELVDHPSCFGKPGREVWGKVWDYLGPIAEQCMAGTPSYKENDGVFYRRYGKYNTLAESYFSWRYVPITGKDGTIQGIFNQCIDTTEAVLLERRTITIRELSEEMLGARNTREYFEAIAESLSRNAADVPFALAYRVQQTSSDATHVHTEVTLEANIGVPDEHVSAPAKFALSVPLRSRAEIGGLHSDKMSSPTLSAISALSSNSWPLHQATPDANQFPILKALTTRRSVIVENCAELIKENFPIRQWDELPFSAIVVPICGEGAVELPEAVLVIGINVRHPFDQEYDNFIRAVRAQLASNWGSVKAKESEQKMLEDNARMDKAKAAWFRGAAHDLRSPLTLISGPIADLLDTGLSAAQRQLVSTAQRNVDRLMRLINALMDFSRLEAGRMEGRFVPTDLGTFVLELASVFAPAVERLRIKYTVEAESSDHLVYIDPTLIETVVSNLIGNALKYTAAGSITVNVRYTDEAAEVSVTDTGIGIPQDEIALVTEWFHRASSVVHAGTQGTGLGLAVTKELLHLHNGELIIESLTEAESKGGRDGKHGSTFTARIPLSFRPAPPTVPMSPTTAFGKYGTAVANEAMRWSLQRQEDDAMSDTTAESVGSKGVSSDADGVLFDRKDLILVVDDNRDLREYIRKIFSPHCIVVEASDGRQALDIAKRNPPDLILSDVVMPNLGGLELLGEIRKDPQTRLVPMILLSAVADEESKMEALTMGAEDYLSKPFKPKELIARVHLHLQVGKKRIKMEKLYMEREAEIAVLSDYCPSGILRGNMQGHLEYANAAWREQSGIMTEEPDVWPDHVDPITRDRLQKVWVKYLTGTEKELRVNWKWNNGRTVTCIFIRLDLVHPGLTGVLGCTTDISHEEQRLVEAEQRRQEAEESKHQQELLIDLTSHEIRTPVSAILQCSSLVKENLVTLRDQLRITGAGGFVPTVKLLEDLEEDVEALESIYQCGLVQERIAGDVLSLARIQLDMLSLHDIEVDLRKEARKVFSVFASEAKMKKIELDLTFGSTIEQAKVLSMKTDPVRLGQVVTNLISNAIRFTASAETRKITVKYDVSFLPPADDDCAPPTSIGAPAVLPAKEDTPLWLFVSVTDTGPGMSGKELSVLFQRFAQGNKMIHTKYGGSGLGLFICRKITELLGGRIEVLSELGQGSVFRFFVRTRTVAPPSALAAYLAAASHGALQSPNSMVRSISMTPTSSVTSDMAPSLTDTTRTSSPPLSESKSEHILIVEDNIINQTVLKRQIVKAGLTCEVANNGLEALNLIKDAQQQVRDGSSHRRMYDVILMDLEMPVMDGLTAIRELRAAEAAGTLSRNMVIALTGNARQGQIDQALAEGMDDVVIKPYVLKNLLTKIRAMTAKREKLADAKKEVV